MKQKDFVNILNDIAKEAIPDGVNLWPNIQIQLKPRISHVNSLRLRPTMRLGWMGLTLVALLAFSSVAYALSPVLRQLFQTDPGLQHVTETGLVQSLHLSQTIDGVTFIVEQAYADANRITIGYTLQTSKDRHYKPQDLKLIWLPDTNLPPTIGLGNEIGGYNLSFDTTAIQDAPRQLDLRLEIYAEEFIYPLELKKLLDRYGSVEKIPQDQLVGLPAPTKGDKVGPFTFNFSIPFLPRQTLSIQQTAEAGGAQIQLVEIEIAPSETQATLCVTPPAAGADFAEWIPIMSLDTGSGESVSNGANYMLRQTEKEFCHRLIFPYPLADQPGQWTMTVNELVGFHKTDVGEQMRLSGPWVFQFDVP